MDILGGLKNNTVEAKSFNGHKHVWLSIIHVALPLLSEKTNLISPQIILQVYKKIVGSQIVAHTLIETGNGPNRPNTIDL